MLGRALESEYLCLEVARELDIGVANVEHRLSPETPFPGPLDDCYAALLHVSSWADELGIDPAHGTTMLVAVLTGCGRRVEEEEGGAELREAPALVVDEGSTTP